MMKPQHFRLVRPHASQAPAEPMRDGGSLDKQQRGSLAAQSGQAEAAVLFRGYARGRLWERAAPAFRGAGATDLLAQGREVLREVLPRVGIQEMHAHL